MSMPDVPSELLVILDPHLADQALAQLRSTATVTQVLAPRLALVRAEPDTTAGVASIAGVVEVHTDVSGELPSDLTPSERLFASAWKARQQPKSRPGDGVPWDSPGFRPPDPPGHGHR